MATAATVEAHAGRLLMIADRFEQARRNLHDVQGGYSPTTPGAKPTSSAPLGRCRADTGDGNPPCTEYEPCPVHNPAGVDQPVERIVLGGDTLEHADLAAMMARADAIGKEIDELAKIIARWGYKAAAAGDHDGCDSCRRIPDDVTGLPSYRERSNGRYCGWCSRAMGELDGALPPLPLVRKHLDGIRVTREELAAAHPTKPRKTTKPNRDRDMNNHPCPRPGCGAVLPAGLFACRPDWFALSPQIRRDINRSWRGICNGDASALDDHNRAEAAAIAHWTGQ